MIASKVEWNSRFRKLKEIIKSPDENLPLIKALAIELHGYTHENNGNTKNSPGNQIWEIPGNLLKFSKSNLYSPAWNLWHSTRIEDISCSYFILDEEEILYSSNFDKLLNVPFLHTGNSMNHQEMEIFNNRIIITALREYRKTVSIRTAKAINEITAELLKSRVMEKSLKDISMNGSVITEDEWLLDYWGKKQISGIFTMPLTRHLLVHLNSAMRCMK